MIYNLELQMNSAIILAGGIGSRLNSDIPKQFIRANNGRRIIDFSIEVFRKNKYINEIIIVLPKEWIDKYGEEYKDYKLVLGGNERYESSKAGLLASSSKSKNIIIHDAARPLITDILIDNCIHYLEEYNAVAPYINSTDSLVMINDNINYLNRDKIKLIQTPQAFDKKTLMAAMKNIKNNISDDMSAILDYNKDTPSKLFKGDIYNFKITNDLDLKIFNTIIYEK